jgi:4-aminobutyrate aminotransferase / (S)-3-amino-2-methylpropionate transaminase / 5-aminovalerate transaminase
MAKEYDLTPRRVPHVQTRLRTIATEIPAPGSAPILESLARLEPVAMRGQPPIVWDRAEGFQVWDAWGNRWIDWSSGVLIANAGHGRKEIRDAVVAQADQKLLTSYCFPTEARARLVQGIASVIPAPLEKVFLLTTGSEAVECAIKLCRNYGVKQGGRSKHVIVSFKNAFHGRTLGSQQAGGTPALKEWIINLDPGFVQIPFPDGIWGEEVGFESFERQLHELHIEPQNVAGVVIETYQGGTGAFAPRAYMQALRKWCSGHKALLVCDEVQAGFGRTGTMWGFEHYGIVPDISTFGKGISSSLPISAVVGRADVMDQFGPGAMTSTHTGNPVCCAAAHASLELIVKEGLVKNAQVMGALLHEKLEAVRLKFADQLAFHAGKGLVAGLICVRPGTRTPDGDLAWDIVRRTIEKGVLMFSPVGNLGSTIKICPPLVITAEAIEESVGAFEEAVTEVIAERKAAGL